MSGPRNYEGNEIKCPYCGDAQSDPWDLYEGDGDHECECQECRKKFCFSVRTEVWFHSKPLKTAQRVV